MLDNCCSRVFFVVALQDEDDDAYLETFDSVLNTKRGEDGGIGSYPDEDEDEDDDYDEHDEANGVENYLDEDDEDSGDESRLDEEEDDEEDNRGDDEHEHDTARNVHGSSNYLCDRQNEKPSETNRSLHYS